MLYSHHCSLKCWGQLHQPTNSPTNSFVRWPTTTAADDTIILLLFDSCGHLHLRAGGFGSTCRRLLGLARLDHCHTWAWLYQRFIKVFIAWIKSLINYFLLWQEKRFWKRKSFRNKIKKCNICNSRHFLTILTLWPCCCWKLWVLKLKPTISS